MRLRTGNAWISVCAHGSASASTAARYIRVITCNRSSATARSACHMMRSVTRSRRVEDGRRRPVKSRDRKANLKGCAGSNPTVTE